MPTSGPTENTWQRVYCDLNIFNLIDISQVIFARVHWTASDELLQSSIGGMATPNCCFFRYTKTVYKYELQNSGEIFVQTYIWCRDTNQTNLSFLHWRWTTIYFCLQLYKVTFVEMNDLTSRFRGKYLILSHVFYTWIHTLLSRWVPSVYIRFWSSGSVWNIIDVERARRAGQLTQIACYPQ